MLEEKAQEATEKVQETESGDNDTDSNNSDNDFWKSKSKDNARENQSLRKRLREIEAQVDSEKKARLSEQGNFRELYQQASEKIKELEPFVEKTKEFDEKFNIVSEFADKLIMKQVPEEYRNLIPDLPIESKLQWVEQAMQKGLFKKQQQAAVGHAAVSLSPKEFEFKKLSDNDKKNLLQSFSGGRKF